MESEGEICLGMHLLQHALQSICLKSEWVYAVFWRILPRNFPPPKWETDNGFGNISGENSRNWMLVWEDGFCDFNNGLHPGLFFKMSHEVYNYGEGLMGKMAANQGHTWIYRDQLAQPEQKYLQNSHPRTWEAQFHSGIQTIALVAVKEGVLQLGSTQKVTEDLNYVIFLRREFKYLLSTPGVLPPHPSSQALMAHATVLSKDSTRSTPENGERNLSQKLKSAEDYRHLQNMNLLGRPDQDYNFQACGGNLNLASHDHQDLHSLDRSGIATVVPSMSSLQALLSKLPSVTPSSSAFPSYMQQPGEDNMDVY